MNEPAKNFSITVLLRSAGELILVVALVFATGWGGARMAEAVHQWPVRPNRSGAIDLRIAKSDRQGSVSFEEGSGYAGWWHCTKDWAVAWKFAPEEPGQYRVEVCVGTFDSAANGRRIEFVVGDEVLEASVPDIGASKWKNIDLGTIALVAKPYTARVQPGRSAEPVNLNLKSVILRPVQPSR